MTGALALFSGHRFDAATIGEIANQAEDPLRTMEQTAAESIGPAPR